MTTTPEQAKAAEVLLQAYASGAPPPTGKLTEQLDGLTVEAAYAI